MLLLCVCVSSSCGVNVRTDCPSTHLQMTPDIITTHPVPILQDPSLSTPPNHSCRVKNSTNRKSNKHGRKWPQVVIVFTPPQGKYLLQLYGTLLPAWRLTSHYRFGSLKFLPITAYLRRGYVCGWFLLSSNEVGLCHVWEGVRWTVTTCLDSKVNAFPFNSIHTVTGVCSAVSGCLDWWHVMQIKCSVKRLMGWQRAEFISRFITAGSRGEVGCGESRTDLKSKSLLVNVKWSYPWA